MKETNDITDVTSDRGTSQTVESTEEGTIDRRGVLRILGAGTGSLLAASLPSALSEESLVSTAAARSGGPNVGVGALPRDQLDGYESWLGRRVDIVSINPGLVSWSHLEAERYAYGIWDDVVSSRDDTRLATWLAMKPRGTGSLTAAAAGEYNDHYRAFARKMVERGLENASVRIAPEFNGRWSPDYAGDNPEAWKEAFRQIVRTTRAVEGTNFEYNWNPNHGNDAMGDPRDAYPGDEYVTEIGVDVYDTTWLWDQYYRDRREQAFEQLLEVENGLNDWRDFAADHGKPLTLPEWGLDDGVHGGGDNSYFVRRLSDWMNENDVRWHSYFNAADSQIYSPGSETLFPDAAATYRDVFGDG